MAHSSQLRVRACAVLLAALSLAATGCTTADPVPPLTSYDQAAIAAGRGPRDTGTYPNLNVPRQAAAAQLSDEERDVKLAALRAEQRRQAPARAETPEERRRRLLRLAEEQEQTLREIEGN
jgi:hypothetical protein